MTWNEFLNRVAASLSDVGLTDVPPAVLAGQQQAVTAAG